MSMYPQAGERPAIDFSGVEFKEGYFPPKRGTIAADYQQGFPIDAELQKRWYAGEGHAIATEFVMQMFRSQGYGEPEVVIIRNDPDNIGGVNMTIKSGFEYATFDVWAISGTMYIQK